MATTPLSSDALNRALMFLAELPRLPSAIRYLDEYQDEWRSVRHPEINDTWILEYDTKTASFDFLVLTDPALRLLAKNFSFWALETGSVARAHKLFSGLLHVVRNFGEEWLYEAVARPPGDLHLHWCQNWVGSVSDLPVLFVKAFHHFLAQRTIGEYRPGHEALIRALPYRWNDHYIGVISGESILAADEEARIIQFLDEAAQAAQSGAADPEQLTRACLLCISYQHGLRPVQIARVELRDVRIYPVNDGGPMVHFVAYRAKKRSGRDKTPFVCKVKHEWAALFVDYVRLRNSGASWRSSSAASDQKLFPLDVATIVRLIGDTTEGLTGVRRTATDLRHTAAQRMADAGASLEEVAHFLGHSHADTSLAYFEASPTQAAMLNKALAISPIYSKVARTLREKAIDKATLNSMAPEKQIGAVPHGVPIAGIGACDLGQSLCPSNPVLACYTCRKFLPIADEAVHRDVLNKLRSVVRYFYDESRGDTQSPAYVQLQRTLEAIQGIFVKGDTP
jgi:integrase